MRILQTYGRRLGPTLIQRLKLRHLHAFLVVADKGSLAVAARQLHVTESAVSKTLRELESLLETRLFSRLPTGMALTGAGLGFHRDAARVLAALERGLAELDRDEANDAPRLRIASSPVASVAYLPPVIARFAQLHPRCRVEIVVAPRSTLLETLRAGRADLGIGRLPTAEDLAGLAFERLALDRFVFAVRRDHPLVAISDKVVPADLMSFPLVRPSRDTIAWHEVERFFSANDLHPSAAVIEILDLPFSATFTATTDAVWVAPRAAIKALGLEHMFYIFDLDVRLLEAPMGLILRSETDRPSHVEEFLRLAREMIPASVPQGG